MFRLGFLLRCAGKEIVLSTPAEVTVLRKVLCPTIQPSELASLAADTAAAMRRLDIPSTVTIIQLFAQHGVRHEDLMLTGLWKVFKADWPLLVGKGETGLMRDFAACTATAFCLTFREGFVHDPQLLAIAFGRCVECAPHLSFHGVVDAYEGIRLFGRRYFSLTEVALYSGGVDADPQALDAVKEPSSSTILSSQPNLVDVLCGELESRLRLTIDGVCEHDAADVVRLMHSLSTVGVMNADTLVSLRRLIESMHVTTELFVDLLAGVLGIHTRVIDVLEHEGDDAWLLSERSALVKVLTEKLPRNLFGDRRRCDPQLVLGLRQVFEMHPALAEDAPSLWDAVRVVRVAHKHATSQKEKKHRLGGALFRPEYAVKVKSIVPDRSEAERFVPPQFKTWRGLGAKNCRHQGSATPQKMGFGTRRISRDYIKQKRRKFAPAVW
ncbi:putative NUDIX hydrolase [Trypanosoma rangeli]|uniref:Putative NUDIX hydrolase n=1 Tax=Trypanosoma rangeli TaxID=5698 RepID=A0A3R7KSE1_TRYRA|nr:putative NUDIX hydrolase [Trypanosoma rangeli]RNF08748.1 putative NUDIX hydrolase [Trypanosoma rangeli]|eukprot:RNF08748.1 putative NUDIX hydrolase [Trypanosoma rangeli]